MAEVVARMRAGGTLGVGGAVPLTAEPVRKIAAATSPAGILVALADPGLPAVAVRTPSRLFSVILVFQVLGCCFAHDA